tara:strand:+ start:4817 stop:5296 length:480 start_codon:yes stop_codon:yes gene_type:complete
MEFVIDLAYFENNTVIDTDFDGDKVQNHLVDAHEIQLRELLGTELYDEVQLWLDNNPTPTAIEQGLIDYLKPFVLKATELNVIPFLNAPVTAKGTMDRSGDYTTRTGNINTGLILDNVRAKMEYYAELCRKYLRKNIINFPSYQCEDGSQDFYSTIYGV